jgi:beta-galactosidase
MTQNYEPLGNTELSHTRPASIPRFMFGTTYYPEHWDAETRKEDAARMAAAGVTVVRMAEFAGDLMERRPGEYDFSFFDAVIEELAQVGIDTILCTPTATPPRWFTVAHPDALRVPESGRREQHGSRQHCCYASPDMRRYSREITRAMADHYRENPCVIGWQTDNEMGCGTTACHCANCEAAFRDFLRDKFDGDIDALNRAWGTAFWSQSYLDFDRIQIPLRSAPQYPNPAQELDYFRSLAQTAAHFQHEQVEILRGTQPGWFVTHNGTFDYVDYRGLFGQDLDFLSYDCYPMFERDPARRGMGQAYNCDRTRALTGNFMIMEQHAGMGGGPHFATDTPEPGELRQMMYRSIAHGADSFVHFRWRTCRFGSEEYWGGILDHDNVPRKRYRELCQEGAELKRIGPEILGTSVQIEAAIAYGDNDATDAHSTLTMGILRENKIGEAVHGELFQKGIAVGCSHPTDDLSGLKLYVIPHWAYFDPAWVAPLQLFVEDGGVLVVGARTATRDVNNNVVAETIPGCLRELCGIAVESYGKQNNTTARPLAFATDGGEPVVSEHWYEEIKADADTEVVAQWQTRHLKGTPAVTRHAVGKGTVYYVATYLNEKTWQCLQPVLLEDAQLRPQLPGCPAGVEVVQRSDADKRLWFLINHTDGPVTVDNVPQGDELITETPCTGTLHLEANDVAIVRHCHE